MACKTRRGGRLQKSRSPATQLKGRGTWGHALAQGPSLLRPLPPHPVDLTRCRGAGSCPLASWGRDPGGTRLEATADMAPLLHMGTWFIEGDTPGVTFMNALSLSSLLP